MQSSRLVGKGARARTLDGVQKCDSIGACKHQIWSRKRIRSSTGRRSAAQQRAVDAIVALDGDNAA